MKCVFLSAVIILLFELPYIKAIQGDYAQVVVPDAQQRAEIIKQQMRDELMAQKSAFGEAPMDLGELDRSPEMKNEYNYQDNGPITPIMTYKKNKDVRHRHKAVTTKKPSTTTQKIEPFNMKPLRMSNRKAKASFKSPRRPSEIFYRRDLDRALNHPVRAIHCIELLSPYLLGETGNGTFKIISINNRKVLRVLQLLSEKTDSSTKDEIYSLLFQISTMNIRLFQWDERAMKLLFNTVIQERVHTFRTLKSGVKKLLAKWHMDLGDISNLLHQTRLFRPPCIQTSELTGSTKTSKATRYTPSKPPAKKTCEPYHDESSDDECVE